MGQSRYRGTWPEPDEALEAAIGRFVIAWSMLEQQVDYGIWDIIRVDDSHARSVTSNLGLKPKLEMFQSLARIIRPGLVSVA